MAYAQPVGEPTTPATPRPPNSFCRVPAHRPIAIAALLSLLGSGCAGTGPISRWRSANDTGLVRPMNDDEKGEGGLLARIWPSVKPPPPFTGPSPLTLDPNGWKKAADPQANPVAAKDEKEALTLFEQGKFAEAETAFIKIAKNRKDTPWGEKAQYYVAECQFQRGKYFWANDSYEKLFADYPGTQYREKLVKREYAIADLWLKAMDPKSPSEAREKPGDRLTGRLPLIGVNDHALKALEHVQHHDSDGPLAEVAAMRVADYHYNRGNWELASVYYDQSLAFYGKKGKQVERAQLLSIDSKMKNYLGPNYDGSGLEQAKVLIKQSLDNFPERNPATAEKLYRTLDQIREEEAKRAYTTAEHYLWTGHLAGAEYYFGEIPVKWPKSPYAPKAKEQLAKIAKMPRKETLPSKIMTRPGASDPYASGVSSANPGGMMSGMMGGPSGP
jgi:outer membrane protein assembly factor BamD (BamD/ComL family)